MGTFCTLIWVAIIVMFAWQKTDILINKKSVSILSTTKDLYYSDQDEFKFKDGLNIAVAFTAFDNVTEWSLNPRMGELVITSYEWGIEDGKPWTDRKPVSYHNCTREELSLDGDGSDARFYPTHGSSHSSVDFYWRKMLCLDKNELRISGDYNSGQARQLSIQLKRCQGDDCASEKEIDEHF